MVLALLGLLGVKEDLGVGGENSWDRGGLLLGAGKNSPTAHPVEALPPHLEVPVQGSESCFRFRISSFPLGFFGSLSVCFT